mgnify:CR=1 FL=1
MSASEMIWEIVEKTNILTSIGNYYSLNNKFILLNVGHLLKRSQNFTKRNKNKMYFTMYIIPPIPKVLFQLLIILKNSGGEEDKIKKKEIK